MMEGRLANEATDLEVQNLRDQVKSWGLKNNLLLKISTRLKKFDRHVQTGQITSEYLLGYLCHDRGCYLSLERQHSSVFEHD